MGQGESEAPKDAQVTIAAEEYERLVDEAKQAGASKDHYLRALADLENSKKRLQRDREDSTRFAAERIIRALLPIMDSFELALKAIDQSDDSFARGARAGIELIFRQLTELLQKEGVQRIEALHKPFDHRLHEALQQVETDEWPDNTVVEEVQVGYTFHGNVLRPSLVKVAKQPAPVPPKPAAS